MQNPRQRGQDDPRPDIDDGPVDLAALRADDALIDALAAGHRQPPANPDGSDDLLVTVLAAWATDVAPDRLPPEQSPTPIDIASEPPRPRPAAARHPYLMRLAAAAVLVVMALSSVAVQAGSAEPGDTLWRVSEVFYADRARSVEAVDKVEVLFEQVRAALRAGQPEVAAEQLAAVRAQLPVIRDDEGRDILVKQEQQLSETANTPRRGLPPSTERPTESPADVRADVGPTATKPAPPAAAAPAAKPAPVTAAAASTTGTAATGGTASTGTAPAASKSPPNTTEPTPTATSSPAPTTKSHAPETSGEASPSNTSSPDATEPSQPRSDSTDPADEGEPEDGSSETGDGSSETG